MVRRSEHGTRAEKREHKKRKRMPVTGKHVFTLQRLAARHPGGTGKPQDVRHGPGRRGSHGRLSVRHASRVNKPRHGRDG
ncbi:MAG: hypothetical protein U0517_02340 [Candidatus Andersenbacteria bacterium]